MGQTLSTVVGYMIVYYLKLIEQMKGFWEKPQKQRLSYRTADNLFGNDDDEGEGNIKY
jgi:hypothetical protein